MTIMTKLKNKGYIYKVTNIITGEFYIGQRSSYKGLPEDDLGFHYFTSSKIVRQLFKNNTSEWQKEILYRDIQYSETLDDMEGFAIHKVINDKLCLNGYDPTSHHGFTMAGRHFSDEARRKMSIAKKGKHQSEETRRKMSVAKKGKPHSDEARRKMSIAKKGSNNHNYGKHFTEETRRKISEARKGKHR